MSDYTFGGYNPANPSAGFSTNGIIGDYLTAGIIDFTEMVISYSVLLKPYEKKTEEVKRVALRQVYPRIGLILSAAKDLDNNLLFSDIDNKSERTVGSNDPNTLGSYTVGTNVGFGAIGSDGRTALENVYRNVTYFITGLQPTSGSYVPNPFTEGITGVAAALTAALLIKQIPINSDIKNVDLGNDIETRALEDLDRILKLFESGRSGSLSSQFAQLPAPNLSESTFHIALDIDPSTLPRSYFDIDPVDEATVINQAQPDAKVRPLQVITIAPEDIAFGWFYISSMEGETYASFTDATTGSTVWKPILDTNPAIERTFVIRNGWNADDIIEALAEEINSYTLTDNATANILAAPNRGELMLQNVAVTRLRMYDEAGDLESPYARKIAAFRMQQQVNHLSFMARRVSSIVTREMVILRFFTLAKTQVAIEALKARPDLSSTFPAGFENFNYQGIWDVSTSYHLGDIVESRLGKEGQIFVCAVTDVDGITGGTDPGSGGTSNWVPILGGYQRLREYKNVATPYVKGLVYGLSPSYTYLDGKGPKSLTLFTKEGGTKTLATKSPDSTTNVPASNKDKLSFLDSDTFFFKKAVETSVINGTLKIRLSSSDLTKIPEELKEHFDPLTGSLLVPLVNVQEAEDVALAVLEKLFLVAPFTELLGALTLPNALQMNSFKKTAEETKEIIDILGPLPDNLELAVGTTRVVSGTIRVIDDAVENTFYQNAIEPKTAYSNKPRSIVIKSTPIDLITTNSTEATSTLVDNKDYGVVKVLQSNRSVRLQGVFDRISFLENMSNGCRRDRE